MLSQTNDFDLDNDELEKKLLELSLELSTLNEKYTKRSQQYGSNKKLLEAERLTVSVSIKINTILCYYFIAKYIISFLII